MFNRKMKQYAAVILGAAMIMTSTAGLATFAEEAAPEQGVSLAIADGDQTEETEAETEAPQTEEKVVFDQLETTNASEAAITAVDVSEVVENTMPSIVAISTKSVQEVESYFYGKQKIEGIGSGSGIIIAQNDEELLIATNNHVADDVEDLTVCFTVDAEDAEDLLVKAVVKGTNAKNDLAVVAVKLADIKPEVLKQLKIATLGSSENLKVGQATIVIGNALGDGQTVSTGIISALEREITTEAGTFTELQTDAAINFGCSGGAILNAKGEVIAITEARAGSNAQNMGYGIPISTAIPVLKDLINRETREAVEKHGYLGVTVVPVSEEAKTMYNMPAGAFVYEMNEDSAAEKAGIKKGDIITSLDGREVNSSTDLVDAVSYYAPGEKVTVVLETNENGSYVTKEVEVTLQEGSADEEEAKDQVDEEIEEKDDKGDNGVSDLDDPDEMDEDDYLYYGDGNDNGFFPFDGFFGNHGFGF